MNTPFCVSLCLLCTLGKQSSSYFGLYFNKTSFSWELVYFLFEVSVTLQFPSAPTHRSFQFPQKCTYSLLLWAFNHACFRVIVFNQKWKSGRYLPAQSRGFNVKQLTFLQTTEMSEVDVHAKRDIFHIKWLLADSDMGGGGEGGGFIIVDKAA